MKKTTIKTHIFMPDEIEILKEYAINQKDVRLRNRFTALLMISENIVIHIIARILLVTVETVERWYEIYLEKGADALNSFNYKPKKCYLTDEQSEELISWIKKEKPSDTKKICDYIHKNFGVSYSRSGVGKLLRKNGIRRIHPILIPGNPPSEEVQHEFIEKYREIRKSADDPESGTVPIFCDPMHLIHQTETASFWGDPSDPPVLFTNSGRQRLNIVGGWNPVTGELIHETDETSCNSDKIIIFSDKLQKTYPKAESIEVILDNAPYFHSAKIMEYIDKNPRISLNFLPPYAPNLNLIERLWKFAKKKLVKNTYYEKYKTFRCHVFRFLNNISNYKDELSTLMTENFQIITYNKQ